MNGLTDKMVKEVLDSFPKKIDPDFMIVPTKCIPVLAEIWVRAGWEVKVRVLVSRKNDGKNRRNRKSTTVTQSKLP